MFCDRKTNRDPSRGITWNGNQTKPDLLAESFVRLMARDGEAALEN